MAKNKAQEPHNRRDPEKGVKRPAPSFPPSSRPTPAPASTPDAGFKPELILIPGGTFAMGSDRVHDRYAYDDENPQHQVSLADFYIAKHPTTNAQYQRFVEATCEVLRELSVADLSQVENLVRDQVEYVNTGYRWETVAGRWSRWLTSLATKTNQDSIASS